MEQIIKKINMIDIFGMLLPGGLMLLLLEMDYHVLRKMGGYFGIKADNLLWVAIFLCVSYFLGMLLHELGSVIEKLMWRNPLLNPRAYAAVSTGLLYNYGAKVSSPKKVCDLQTGEGLAHKIEKKWKWISKLRNSRWINAIRMIWRAGLSLIAWWVAFYAAGELEPEEYIGITVVVILGCILLQWKYFSKFMVAAFDKNLNKRMQQIVEDERVIQKEAVTSEENSRKYGLFCGYYALMRSVLVLMALLQIYINIQDQAKRTALALFYESMAKLPSYPYLRYVIVAALVLRYWHYACAKFTYTYNGYINNKLFPKDEDKTTKLNVEFKQVP